MDNRGESTAFDVIDVFDLTVTDVGEEAASFAKHEEGGGCICSCGCFGGPTKCV